MHTLTCPRCGAQLTSEARFCGLCGQDLQAPALAPPTSTPTGSPGVPPKRSSAWLYASGIVVVIAVLAGVGFAGYQFLQEERRPLSASALDGELERSRADAIKRVTDAGMLESGKSVSLTPLIEAAMRGDVENLEASIAAGADVNARDSGGSTALHWAAFHGHPEAVKTLIAKRADVNAKNNSGATAVRAARGARHQDIVRILERSGAQE